MKWGLRIFAAVATISWVCTLSVFMNFDSWFGGLLTTLFHGHIVIACINQLFKEETK